MNAFIEKHQKHIIEVLSGWDRLVFRGTLRLIALEIAARLYPDAGPQDVSAKVTYLLRLLRQHEIIRRLPRTRRYRLTPGVAQIIATIFLTQNATSQQLNKAAA
jgi:hypothetical protein